MARELASRRGLNLSRDQEQLSNIPMNSYLYGSDDNIGMPEQKLRSVSMGYNNEDYVTGNRGGGLKELTWGGLKEQNDMKYKNRYERMSRDTDRRQRYKQPQPPRQPPLPFTGRNDSYQSNPSPLRAQSIGERTRYEVGRKLQSPKSQSSPNSNSVYPFELNRVNKLSKLASTSSSRIDSPGNRPIPQYPAQNAQLRQNILYQQPIPFRPPSTLSGFASTSEQMGRSGPSTQSFIPPPPPPYFTQMPQYQQRRPSPNLRPSSIPLSYLALQPNIQPLDQPPQPTTQHFQDMPRTDQRQQLQSPLPPPSYASVGNPSASFTPLPFQQMSQADFTRPFQGSQQNQQQANTVYAGATRPKPSEFNGPPHPFNGPSQPFGQEPPPPFSPVVHIFQNPFMKEPMFQNSHKPTPSKQTDSNIKVPKDPNTEKTRRQTPQQSLSNNSGSGMKIPKDPMIELRRKQQATNQPNDGLKVPRDPFLERQKLQKQKPDTSASANLSNEEVRVPKEPTIKPQIERRPKEPKLKTRLPKETRVVSKGEDMPYEDFASFFDMPKL